MKDIGPGDVVVCVDASGDKPGKIPLIEGRRYRVRWVGPSMDQDDFEKFVGVRLHGLQNPAGRNGLERVYNLTRFRPIDSRDSEIFRQMIADTKHFKVRAHHG